MFIPYVLPLGAGGYVDLKWETCILNFTIKMINTKLEIEHRTKDLSLCSTVSPVAPCATNRIQPSKARSSLVNHTLQGGPLLGIVKPIWIKVTESEERVAWMLDMIRKGLVVRDLDVLANNLNEKLRTDEMKVKEEERIVLLDVMRIKLRDERRNLEKLKRKREETRLFVKKEIGRSRKFETLMKIVRKEVANKKKVLKENLKHSKVELLK